MGKTTKLVRLFSSIDLSCVTTHFKKLRFIFQNASISTIFKHFKE